MRPRGTPACFSGTCRLLLAVEFGVFKHCVLDARNGSTRSWCRHALSPARAERCRGQKPVRGIFCSSSCSLGALAYNSAHDERTRHTISQSRARRVGWSMALASSLLSELEAPFSCTRMTKRRKALIFRRLEASPISANYVRHARKAVPCSLPMNSSTLLKSNSRP